MNRVLKHLFQGGIGLASLLFLQACNNEGNDVPPVLEAQPTTITLSNHEGTATLSINSNVEWTLESNAGWCEVGATAGTGEAQVTVQVSENTNSIDRNAKLTLAGGGLEREVTVTQRAFAFSLDSTALHFPPEGGEKQLKVFTNVEWQATTDATWLQFTPKSGNDTTDVIVKVEPNEGIGERTAIVEIQSGVQQKQLTIVQSCLPREVHADGTVSLYDANDEGHPIKIVFMGDGFTAEDLVVGGAYDQAMEEAIAAFFSTEPYPTYRQHFAPYIVYAVSEERGISIAKDASAANPVYNDERNTIFKVRKTQGYSTLMNGDLNKIWEYAHKVPGLEDTKTTIVVVSNSDPYAGTCYHYGDGRSISLIPMNRDLNPPGGFDHLITHESAGHGFGRLADEYTGNGMIPESEIQTLEQHHHAGQFKNVVTTKDPSQTYWGQLIGMEGYESVGFYEGAYLYAQGVWRCEEYSCMIDNIHYFSVASRMAIVERIMEIIGEPFYIEQFTKLDKQRKPTEEQLQGSYTMPLIYDYPPATPPVFVED